MRLVHRIAKAGQRLGDAEIEQLGLAIGADQDISRLDVAMQDQVPVCVIDGAANWQEYAQPFP
ncbi:MAG: hypothetical protein R3F00_07615 [Dokdonella sp.]